MFFSNTKKITSEEFEILNRKIVLLVGDVDTLKTENANLKLRINSLTGRINRTKTEIEDSEDLNKSVLLTNNGFPINSK